MLVLLLAAFSVCAQDGGSFYANATSKDLLHFQLPACFKPIGKFTCVAHNESSRFTRLQVVIRKRVVVVYSPDADTQPDDPITVRCTHVPPLRPLILDGGYRAEMQDPAIERLRAKPGFLDYPEGFEIHSRELNQDRWTEGFIRK